MAVDHALMAGARAGGAVLRFYGWDPPCLSLGRNQRARERFRGAEGGSGGVDVVRRPTGGRAVYHHEEITYAVAAPAGLWGGLRESYGRVNAALRRGLELLGVPVALQETRPGRRAPSPDGRACFRDPLPGEVTAGGRKLVGSAQWRKDGALLQHGSILLRDQQGVVGELRRGEGAGRSDGRWAAALADVLDPVPGTERIVECLSRGFQAEFGARVERGEMTPEERTRARELEELYAGEEWTWRR